MARSHDEILKQLSSWGKVLEISFKLQHKFQSIWTKMILRPAIDTDFVMRTWWQKLDGQYVRWFPGHWKLKDRKERERFQAKLHIPSDAPDEKFANFQNGKPLDVFMQKTLRGKSCSAYMEKGNKFLTIYFESQKDLHQALEIPCDWKLTISHSPFNRQPQSNKDKKKNLKSLKGKKADPKVSTSSNKKNSRDKPNKHNKVNDDTRSLLKIILNLLS
ncbi:hypothetical protein RhiirA4_428726 [Rhizophagus irregularis]|uniref:Uncharacterized protein n=1 Tax=Rhizophagus irregularis TaxID=588596 RepID=A0A2I1HE16_9GLOM|nr:hypothetical protein RhiirA4_428726 [Rhizophagus irregularis]